MSEITIVEADQGKTFEAKPGDFIVIRLPENSTTGYLWEIGGVNEQLMECQDSDYLLASGVGIGGGGIRILRFRAKSTGTGQVQLRLRRSWEPESSASQHFTVNIRVL